MRGDGAFAKKLSVQHQRQPRERMPVGVLATSESPLDIRPIEAAEHMGIGEEIDVIVIINESIVPNWKINSQVGHGQQQTDPGRARKKAKLAGGGRIQSKELICGL